ncbi:MAG TPA: hypothetical protein PKC49_00860 [Phycisphaerae bacterium]|nr:hypothetical protein [Phycisphaerae bacterium]
MIVEGGVCPGDTKFMLRCMIEELLCGGVALRQIDQMARDQNYQALFAARETLGDTAFSAVLAGAARSVGVHACRVYEASINTIPVDLTIHGPCSNKKETS